MQQAFPKVENERHTELIFAAEKFNALQDDFILTSVYYSTFVGEKTSLFFRPVSTFNVF